MELCSINNLSFKQVFHNDQSKTEKNVLNSTQRAEFLGVFARVIMTVNQQIVAENFHTQKSQLILETDGKRQMSSKTQTYPLLICNNSP